MDRDWRLLHGRPERLQLALFLTCLTSTMVFAGGLWGERWTIAIAGAALGALTFAIGVAREMRLPAAKARIGNEGLLCRTHAGPRYVAFPRVRSISVEEIGADHGAVRVRVALEGGEVLRLRTREAGFAPALRAALEAFRAWSPEAPHPSLAREERTTEQWVEDVRALATKGDYRVAHPAPAVLVRIAEDPHGSVEQRVGAALALGVGADESLKARVRAAAQATADPELAVALEGAVDGAGTSTSAR